MSFRSYQENHFFRQFPVKGGRFEHLVYPREAAEAGPVFPSFLAADFSTYEGFVKFADSFGLDGFGWFSEELEDQIDNRWEALERLRAGKTARAKYKQPLERVLEKVWEEIQSRLVEEQSRLQRFFEFQQQLHKKNKIRVANPNASLTGAGIHIAPNLPFNYLFEPLGDLKEVLPYLRVELEPELDYSTISSDSGTWKFAKSAPDGLLVAVKSVPSDTVSKVLKWRPRYPSIVHRCFIEIADVIADGKTAKTCPCCQKIFIPKRPNEKYCSRQFVDYGYEVAYHKLLRKQDTEYSALIESLELQTPDDTWTAEPEFTEIDADDWRLRRESLEALSAIEEKQRNEMQDFYRRHTCKKVGPQKTMEERLKKKLGEELGKKELQRKQERKELLNHRGYLKRTGREKTVEYKAVQKALNQLDKAKTNP